MTTPRTKHTYQTQVLDFIDNILVVCPSCSKQAIVKTLDLPFSDINGQEIKVTCSNCGYNKRLEEKPNAILYSSSPKTIEGRFLTIGGLVDPYFHLPLWLTINCCNNTLWAYNYNHLQFLEKHVEAKLRERNTKAMSNKSLGSRLPKWMTSTNNRESVLKAIAQLKQKV